MASVRGPLPSRPSCGKYDASSHTTSTLSTTSEDFSPCKLGKGILRGKKLQTSATPLSSGRDLIMNLIANEMTSTFLGEDDQEVAESNANVPSYKMSAEELFYAQMNGEAIHHPSSNTESTGISPKKDLEASEASLDFDDDCSFGALTIPDDMRADKELTNRRSSVGSGSKNSSHGKSSSKGSKASARSSGTKKTVQSESSSSSSGNETLSMEEIQEYVMNNLPPEVRDKIPMEAWSHIFGKSMRAAKTRRRSSKDARNCKVENDDNDDDDSSVISDITEYTTHPGSIIESSNETRDLKPEELDWDEEVCPGLDVSRRSHDPDNKSKSSSSNSSREGGSQRYRIDSSGNVCSSQKANSKVVFSHVQVRYYERILEINPAVTSGPAIGIGWRFKRGGTMDVEDWELQRGGASRRNNELIIPRDVRERILKEAGYDQKQIAEAVRIIRKAKDRRKVTVQNLGGSTEAMEETVEAASRRIKGILSFGTKRGLLKSYS